MASLPKAHLHVHLEGAARAATISELATRNGLPSPNLRAYTDLAGFIACYRRVTDLIRDPPDLARIITEFVADEATAHVLYSEPMIGPQLYAQRFGWTIEEAFSFIDDTFQHAARQHNIEVRYLLGVNWERPLETIEDAARFAAEHVDRHVAAFGFAGVEPTGEFDRYQRACDAARAHGLLVVPHLGETRGPAVIRAAVEALRPHRIAHGIRAAADVELLRDLAARRIVCDVCPTSNVRLGIFTDIRQHPLPLLVKHGVAVTVNADDPLLLDTTLTGEYLRARGAWNLTERQIADLASSGLHAAGMTKTTQLRFHSTMRQWLTDAVDSSLLQEGRHGRHERGRVSDPGDRPRTDHQR